MVAEKGMSEESLQMLCAAQGDEIRRSIDISTRGERVPKGKILSLCSPAITVAGHW
jgi:hypothetical protein